MNDKGNGSPMVSTASAYGRYKSDAVETMSPGRLIVALYDRLLLDLRRAVESVAQDDFSTAHGALVHAQDIVAELHDSLDVDAWPGGASLAAIYEFLTRELVTANVDKDGSRIVVCHDLVVPLRNAWCEAAGISV